MNIPSVIKILTVLVVKNRDHPEAFPLSRGSGSSTSFCVFCVHNLEQNKEVNEEMTLR